MERIHRLSKSAIRAIFLSPPWASSLPLFTQLNLLPLSAMLEVKRLCLAFRFVHNLTSPLFSSILTTRSGRLTQGSSFRDLVLPSVRYSSSNPFSLSTAISWNATPREIRSSDSVHKFKTLVMDHLGNPVKRP